MALGPASTPSGKLPPMEVAKAIAFEKVISCMEKHLGKTCWELLGKSKKDFTAGQLKTIGGQRPSGRAVQKHWTKVKLDGKWFPGKKLPTTAGRPPLITQAQKRAIADKAMELKEDYEAPTPEKIRVCLPRLTINKGTKASMSDWSIYQVFKTMCYDESEDDPWQFLPSLQQDCLTDEMKPPRVSTAKHVLNNINEHAAWNFVAIDPCISLLPRRQEKADLLKIAAMGHSKWMSKKSRRKGVNLRAPATAKTQKNKSDSAWVPWTPVFARGCLRLVVLTEPKAKLSNAKKIAEFVKDKLPGVLEGMQKEFNWSSIPRVILHDKASYFVNNSQNQLQDTFAAGLRAGRFRSWAEDGTSWLAGHLGDFYPHESVISHVRRLLSTKFAKCSLYETPTQFKARMKRVEDYLNYEMKGGDSLEKLGKALHTRAQLLKDLQGERLPK